MATVERQYARLDVQAGGVLLACLVYTAIFMQTKWFLNDEILHFVFGIGIYHGLLVIRPHVPVRLTHRRALVAILLGAIALETYKWFVLDASLTANMQWFYEDLMFDTVLALYAGTLCHYHYRCNTE